MRSSLLSLSCLLSSSRVCAAAPASLIADLPDVGDEGEDEEFMPIGDGRKAKVSRLVLWWHVVHWALWLHRGVLIPLWAHGCLMAIPNLRSSCP